MDLSLRAREAGRGVPALVIAARATTTTGGPELGEDAGERFGRLHPVPSPGTAECLAGAGFAVAQGRLVPTRDATGPTPTLRWAIDIAATPGPWGERWGDLHFAKSLAAALRRLGQQVAIDHRGAGRRASREYDDVVLTLRGLYPVPAQPGRVNLLWVISHPDEVTADELRGYHRVFAAGPAWAAAKQADWGVRIDPLLQCTDITRFNPERAEPGSGPAVLFVGNTRHVSRPVVDHALRSGAAVSIYGTGWEDTSAAGYVIARNVPNADLGALYAGAGVVLNDHWADMRDLGFVSNRLFDAVACAAQGAQRSRPGRRRAVRRQRPGVHRRRGRCRPAAQRDPERPTGRAWDDRRAIARAEAVRAAHSFDRRAEQLLARCAQLSEQAPESASSSTLRTTSVVRVRGMHGSIRGSCGASGGVSGNRRANRPSLSVRAGGLRERFARPSVRRSPLTSGTDATGRGPWASRCSPLQAAAPRAWAVRARDRS